MHFAKYVKVRQEKFGAVVFETLKEKVFVTNKTGSEILCLLEEGRSQDEITRLLKDKFEENSTDINKDIVDFINELKKNNILVE